ncbi:MAG: DUF6049 family protein [Nitriliruptoraceae bacterium]
METVHRPRSLLIALVVLMTSVGMPAQAQTPDDDALRLTVSALSAVLGPGSVPPVDAATTMDAPRADMDLQFRLLIENVGTEPLDQLRVVTEFFPAADSRDALHDALNGGLDGPAAQVFERDVREGGPLAPREIAGHRERLSPDDLSWTERGGVHPIRIAVMRGTLVLAEVVTAAVWLPQNPATPIPTVFVWPLDQAPTAGVGSTYAPGADRALVAGGRLDDLLRALGRVSPNGVVLAPAAHLLEELQDRADGFTLVEPRNVDTARRSVEPEDPEARLANDVLQRIRDRADATTHPPVSATYARADLSSLLDADEPPLTALASLAALEGAARTQALLDREPDAATHLLDGALDERALDLLPASRLLVPVDALDADLDGDDPAVRTLVTPAGRTMTALVADPFVSTTLSRPDLRNGVATAVQRVVASSAMAMFDADRGSGQPLIIVPRHDWDPGAALAAGILTELSSATWIELVSPATVAATTGRPTATLALANPERGLDAEFLGDLAAARRELTAAHGALPVEVTTIGGHPPAALETALLRAGSSLLAVGGQTHAAMLVDDVRQAVADTFGTVSVTASRVTLTSDTGQVPITLQRQGDLPVMVRVEVSSPGRLTWPDGRVSEPLALGEDGGQTVSFATTARSTGTFPVTVRVTDPTGSQVLTTATVVVRSTALSGPALGVIGALVALLLVAGLFRARRRRPLLAVVDRNNDT